MEVKSDTAPGGAHMAGDFVAEIDETTARAAPGAGWAASGRSDAGGNPRMCETPHSPRRDQRRRGSTVVARA